MINFEPYSLAFADDPYPVYKQLRDEAPLYYHQDLNFWALSRYEDVTAAHYDHATFASAGGPSIEMQPYNGSLVSTDMPDHRWHKVLVTKVFTPKLMNAMEDFVRAQCVNLLEGAAAGGEFDFVNDFAVHLPLNVISELAGIPEEVRADIHRFADMQLLRGDVDMAEILKAKEASDRTYLELIRERRARPQDDVISLLIASEQEDDDGVIRRLRDEELIGRFNELAVAGHETAAKTLANGAAALTQFPAEREKLIADPSRLPAAIEEMLRLEAPVQMLGRTTTRDVELHGETIPKGAKTMLLVGSATRDERKFERPDTFDIGRTPDPISPYFGYGIHRCLGIHLARMELRVAFEELLSRFPEFEVFPDRATRRVLTVVRGYDTLPCQPGPHH